MGIKSFFQGIGRGISRGFKSFVAGAGNLIGGAGTWLQRKGIPAIASGANQVAGILGKAAPLLDAAGPEAAAAGAEAADVASKVGAGVGQFAKFIGSDIANQPVKVANAEQIAAFQQSPLGMAFRRSQTKAPAPAPAPVSAPAPKPSIFANMPMPKGLISPAPQNPLKVPGAIKPLIGSNPASYSPVMASGIEAPPASSQASIKVVGSAPSGMLSM